MSDVQSQVKPLTTGRVIFAIAGIYVTQSLVSALSMQSLPALVRAAGGSLGDFPTRRSPHCLRCFYSRVRLPPPSILPATAFVSISSVAQVTAGETAFRSAAAIWE